MTAFNPKKDAHHVHLSALELLREYLTEANHGELFEAVLGKSKRDVELILASRFPKPDVPSRITRTRVEPLSETRFKVEFTASAELREKMELCRDLMSHVNPSRDLAVVIEQAVDLLVEKLQRERLAAVKRKARSPRDTAGTTKPLRISRATRRDVFARDGVQCTYVSPGGRRCEARAFLELDHVEPRALGGADSAANLRVRCRPHNQLAAEQVFGRQPVELSRHFRRQECSPELDKVHGALRRLGFGNEEVRRALGEVRGQAEGELTVEELLRRAVLVATRVA